MTALGSLGQIEAGIRASSRCSLQAQGPKDLGLRICTALPGTVAGSWWEVEQIGLELMPSNIWCWLDSDFSL